MRDLRTAQAATALFLALLVSACGRDQPVAPTAPTAPKAPTGPTFALSGVITDRMSARPIPGVQVAIWPEPAPTTGSGWSPGFGVTDATGHYKISNWPDWTGTAWVQASKDGYMQQCVATATIQSDTSLDIALTPISNLAVEKSPATTGAVGSRTVSGIVFEVTPDGRRPVENASVGWEHFLDFVVAETRSDSAGRYLLCGLPEGRIVGLFAQKPPDTVYVSVDPGTDTVIDMEVKQQ
jgi:Carboxypeptidase regulatory-like domain